MNPDGREGLIVHVDPASIDPRRYAMRSVTGTVTVLVDAFTWDGQMVASFAVDVGTTNKTWDVLMDESNFAHQPEYRYYLVRSITGGSVYFNLSGVIDPVTGVGSVGQTVSSSGVNSDQLVAGMYLGVQ